MADNGSKGQPQFVLGDGAAIANYLTRVANYAALVGNSIAGTSAQRSDFANQYGFAPFQDLEFRETDTGNRYRNTVNGWVGIKSQSGAVAFGNALPDGTGNGGFYWTRDVSFTANRFTTPPIVTFGVFTGATVDQHAGAINVTAAGFTLYFWRGDNTGTTIGWTASPID